MYNNVGSSIGKTKCALLFQQNVLSSFIVPIKEVNKKYTDAIRKLTENGTYTYLKSTLAALPGAT
jgi:hypothetical protein